MVLEDAYRRRVASSDNLTSFVEVHIFGHHKFADIGKNLRFRIFVIEVADFAI